MFGRPSRRVRRRLEERGRTAMATVLEFTSSVTTINHWGSGRDPNKSEFCQRMRLRVEPDGEPPFEVERRMRVPFSSPVRPGSRIAVRYDPDHHATIMRVDEPPADASRTDREHAAMREMSAEGKSVDEMIAAIAAERAAQRGGD